MHQIPNERLELVPVPHDFCATQLAHHAMYLLQFIWGSDADMVEESNLMPRKVILVLGRSVLPGAIGIPNFSHVANVVLSACWHLGEDGAPCPVGFVSTSSGIPLLGPRGREVPGVYRTGVPPLGPLMLMLILPSSPRPCLIEGGFEGTGVGGVSCTVHKALATRGLCGLMCIRPVLHAHSLQFAFCWFSLHTTRAC